ncbi:DeoR faimly transcriptional regulator [Arsukibacterium ikkense]|uniref:DeoR faimly transcriptional regulator n=1 Tax=Arsukibacterium ikkense TaxID=336831 RepID=A0A0M2V7J3_9GAMM|nr:peptide MFS transporter [Arsukibacterium ikkense]KKO45630.1 DeoR faimly transcriptional regulator [Arsukibacterium ikkense]
MSLPKLPSGELLGHPKGLFLLFGTEMWERFSYYAMRALLVLYLVDKVRAEGGGLGWEYASALQLYGTFTMLVYVTPLLGGWLADHITGQRLAIIIGSILMAIGQFSLALPHAWLPGYEMHAFYTGLGFLVLGNGLFKPNISTMVGDLYQPGDNRRDGAFTVFYLGVNLGMFLAGICVGLMIDQFGYQLALDGETVQIRNYQAGFLLAGFGMLIALVLQMTLAKPLLGSIGIEPAAKRERRLQQGPRKTPLTKQEVDRLKVILIMGLFTIIFWAGFEQAGGLMNIYADRFVDRTLNIGEGAVELNPAYFQALNPLFIMIFAPLFAMLWLKLGKHDPNSPLKFALGLALMAIGFLMMVAATLQYSTEHQSSLWWLVLAYLFFTLGELCLSPIGLAMVTRLSPLRMASLMMGAWYFFMAGANKLAGLIGALIGTNDAATDQQMVANAGAIFGGFTLAALLAALLLYLWADKLVYWMHGSAAPIQAAPLQGAPIKVATPPQQI